MESSNSQKINKLLPWLCSLIYFMSYLSRKIYSVSVEIIRDTESVEKSIAGLAITGLFISYGIGQIISGVLGDKINSRKLIAIGMVGTAVCNFGVGIMPQFSKNIVLVTVLWIINGLFQSFFWPPILKLLSINCTSEYYMKGVSRTVIFSQIAEILLYLIVPASNKLFNNWRISFITISVMCVMVAVIWWFNTKNVQSGVVIPKKNIETHRYTSKALMAALIASGLLLYSIPIVIMGMIRDGVTTWAPSFTRETFNISKELSILITVVIALLSMIGIKISGAIQKKINNEMITSTLFFGTATVCMVLLMFFYDKVAILTTVLMAISIACMHGTNLMLIGCIPSYFKYTGRVGTVSGIVNGIIYAGSAISIFGFAKISEKLDWRYVVLIWVIVCALGTLMLFFNIRRWKRFSGFMIEKTETETEEAK